MARASGTFSGISASPSAAALILLPDASQQPLSVYLSQINAGEIGIAFAAAVIYMVPGLLMFLHGEAYLVEGITYAGSVKG